MVVLMIKYSSMRFFISLRNHVYKGGPGEAQGSYLMIRFNMYLILLCMCADFMRVGI